MSNIPNFAIASNLPPILLEEIFVKNKFTIEQWFRNKWYSNKPPFYGSVDLRNNGIKLVPVDMNLFPGGFNNINEAFIPLAIQAINDLIKQYCPNAKKLLLIPENHTRNKAYLKNVYTLNFILQQAGIETAIGTLSSEITEITKIQITENNFLTYKPIQRIKNRILTVDGFDPCIVLLNNDLSSGKPQILENLEQTLLPPLNAGWYMRKKTNFFYTYEKICLEFAELLNIDPWIINPLFSHVKNLDFANNINIETLAQEVDILLNKIRNKYKQYNINLDPYVVIKANSGTYGMGIMMVKTADELLKINRKIKNKMSVIKDGQEVHDVIVQEGVHTIETINNQVAEPVIYMLNYSVIGAFYRTNPQKLNDENLNATGSQFVPFDYACSCLSVPKRKNNENCICPPNRFYTYSVISRLALLASSIELSEYK